MNDAQEKLNQAEEWIDNCDINSEQFKAAVEHATYVFTTTEDPALHVQAHKLMAKILGEAWFN